MTEPGIAWYTGPCILVVCKAEVPHGHLSCPDCGSVTFRNSDCQTCISAWGGKAPDKNEVPMMSVDDVRMRYRSVTCPKCLAVPGEKCRDYRGMSTMEHRKRVGRYFVLFDRFGWVNHD